MIKEINRVTSLPRSLLTINKEAIKNNVKEIARFTGKRIIAVVKSNAYGVGVAQISSVLKELDEVDTFAVATVGEGAELRELGIKKRILVLGGVLPEELRTLKEYGLTPVISDIEHLKVIGSENIPFHIKYDTGMGRLGFVNEFIMDPRIEGVMSHLSTPADSEFSREQIEKFERIIRRYEGKNLIVHLESSAGLIYKVPSTTHVRVGLALYGEKPLKDYPLNLSPSLTLRSKLISVKDVPAGFPISYGRTFVTQKPTRIGVVAFGYADGLMKVLSNKISLLWRDFKLPVIGNITMDMTVVDLGECPARVGDWVTVVNEKQTFGDLAKIAGTIPYELMCNISERVVREVI